MIKRIKLKYDGWGFYDDGKAAVWAVCVGDVQEHFDIPEDVTVWFTAHKRPALNRVKIDLSSGGRIRIDGRVHYWLGSTGDAIKALLKSRKAIYVEVEYE